MAKIIYTEHLKTRLSLRNIPKEYPKQIFKSPNQTFYDGIQKTKIAVKKLKYNNKIRDMMIAYDQKNNITEIITIHPISEEKIINRVIKGRWIRNE